MAEIDISTKYFGEPITGVSKLLDNISKWHRDNKMLAPDVHRRVWYRGHEDSSYNLWPGVYRNNFTQEAKGMPGKNIEEQRLNLEREMLSEFRTSGATLVDPDAILDVYFIAQHHGMPTRLLDWTTNPLAALFFAVCSQNGLDADLFVMDAPKLLPSPPTPKPHKFPSGIVTMRHPYATNAIGQSFWLKPQFNPVPLILPIRPDNRAGRISQQSSCFTLHMHLSKRCENPTLARFKIEGKTKGNILGELRKLNINEFSIYGDLDHLSKEIKLSRALL